MPPDRISAPRLFGQAVLFFGFLALILGRLAPVWPVLDVLAQLTLQVAFVTLATLTALAIRRIGPAALALAAMAAAWGAVPNLVAAVDPDAPRAPGTLRIATFSTLGRNDDYPAVAAEIRRIAPDIMVLTEIWPKKRPLLDDLRRDFPYQHACAAVADCQIAILSRFPFATVEDHGIWQGPPEVMVQFSPALGGLRLIGLHLPRFPAQARQQRETEGLIAQVLELLATSDGGEAAGQIKPLIVLGDFNATPFSVIPRTIAAATPLRRQTWLPTWPSFVGMPQVALDHIFLGPGIAAASAPALGRSAGSDHYPVWMDVILPAGGAEN